jgi:hypothetical protein
MPLSVQAGYRRLWRSASLGIHQALFRPMRCPSCDSTDHTCVLNTVHREDGVVRRRRGCRLCQIRWTTRERLEAGSLLKAFVPRPVVGNEEQAVRKIAT